MIQRARAAGVTTRSSRRRTEPESSSNGSNTVTCDDAEEERRDATNADAGNTEEDALKVRPVSPPIPFC